MLRHFLNVWLGLLLAHYDRNPALYWTVTSIAMAGLLFAVFVPFRRQLAANLPERGRPELFFAAAMALALFAGRWPYLCFHHFFNPDESQQIAGAITLTHDPRFWFAVDGHTAGPADFYFLCWPAIWGGSINYTTARLSALILVFGILWFGYKTLRLQVSPIIARVGLLPTLIFFSWIQDSDFVEISTEHLSVFLLSAAVYFFLAPILRPTTDRRQLFSWAWAGFFAGIAPWAKLQSVVAVLGLLAGSVFWAYRLRPIRPARERFRSLLFFCAGLALPTFLFGSLIVVTGQCSTFCMSYLVANFDYAYRGTSKLYLLGQFWNDASETGLFPVLFLGALGWFTVARWCAWKRRQKTAPLLSWSGGYTLVALCTVLSPGRPYLHYLLYLVPALGLFIGASWAEITEAPFFRRHAGIGSAVFIVSFFLPFLVVRTWFPVPFEGALRKAWHFPLSRAACLIKPHLHSGDTVAIWGWVPDLYVELQAPQGARDAHTQREIENTPFQSYYRGRYLEDLQRNRPVAFVDTVGTNAFIFSDRSRFGFEIFPALKTYIGTHYTLVDDRVVARVYLRNDRLAPCGDRILRLETLDWR